MTKQTLLVGDVGGTSVRFALADVDGEGVVLSEVWKRPGAGFASFEAALDAFLAQAGAGFDGAAFGLAGVTGGERVELLNRGWTVDVAQVRKRLAVGRLVVVNDFFAMARSAPELGEDETEEIRPGAADPAGCIAVGGPGTGFGLAILRPSPLGWIVVGGEGGHQAFTPQTDLEWRVMEGMRARAGDVSNELVAAGVGFELTRDVLAEVMGVGPRSLSPAEVIEAARSGDAFALAFCRLRAAAVMTAMGNLALVCNATGGVFIAGGVGLRLAPWLREAAALERFGAHGPRAQMLRGIPIRLIRDEAAPLKGAAHVWLDEQRRGWV